MIFQKTSLHGAFLIEPERKEDDRGFFARIWCRQEFTERGLDAELTQCNISFNKREGTLRGMHYQKAPHGETKLVRCTMGAIYDVLVDMRPESPTYKNWLAVELSSDNRLMLYIPEGIAHGFQTLTDKSEVFYQMSHEHHPECAVGFRWNDPTIGIRWPRAINVISSRDQDWPDLSDGTSNT